MNGTAYSPLSSVRAWINTHPHLHGSDVAPGLLANGAFLELERSPASGAYVLIEQAPEGQPRNPVAEDWRVTNTRIAHYVYASKPAVANRAAKALADAVQACTGDPVPVPGTDTLIMVTDNVQGPASVARSQATGGEYCFQVMADYLLYDNSDDGS